MPIKAQFIPKNPQKYIGPNLRSIVYRSSWEQQLMLTLDNHPDVLGWSSESIKIPYENPFTGRWTIYIPDFVVVYMDRKRNRVTEMIEVKPKEQMSGYLGKVSKLTEANQILNAAKWKAAIAFCEKRNWKFRVANEDQMFAIRRYTNSL